MNVGRNEVSIGLVDSSLGVGVSKSSIELPVSGQPPVSFASRFVASHLPLKGILLRQFAPDPVKAIAVVPGISLNEGGKQTIPAKCGLEKTLAVSENKTLAGSDSKSGAKAERQISLPSCPTSLPAVAVSISASMSAIDKNNALRHPETIDRATKIHVEATKQVAGHALVHRGDAAPQQVLGMGHIVAPPIQNVALNRSEPPMADTKLLPDSSVTASYDTRDRITKSQVRPLRAVPFTGVTPDVSLQNPIGGGVAGVSGDGKSAAPNQDVLLLPKPSILENVLLVAPLTQGFSVSSTGLSISPRLTLVESKVALSLLETHGHQHGSDPADVAPGTSGYSVDDVSHSVLQASTSALEVGLRNGAHGWVKIRAEVDGGGLVNATLSAKSASGQEMLHRELSGLTRFLQTEQVAVQPSVAEHIVATGLHAGAGSWGGTTDAQSGSQPKGEERLSKVGDSLISSGEGSAQSDTLASRVVDVRPLLRNGENGGWLNVRV